MEKKRAKTENRQKMSISIYCAQNVPRKAQCSRGGSCSFKHDFNNRREQGKEEDPVLSPKREDTRKETEKGYIKGKAPNGTGPSGKSNEPVCTHFLNEQSQKECNCVLNGGPTTTFSIRSILRKLGWTPAKTQYSVRYRRNAERHFRTRERKGPSQGLIQRGPRNDRNPNALANKDLHRQWTQHCENTHEQQRGNGTQLFTKSAGRIQKTRIRFSKAKTVTGASSRTGIRHKKREFTVDSGASIR